MKTDAHEDRAHSVLGGSKAEIWVNCPGSVAFCQDIEEPKAGPRAELGTKIHEISEICLADFLAHKVDGSDPDIRYTLHPEQDEDIRQMAETYRDAVWEKALFKSITGKAYGIEDRFDLHEKLNMYGFVDFWAVYISRRGLRTGVIVDLKTGYHEVTPEKNLQLLYYACAFRKFFRDNNKDLDRVRVAICQPTKGEGTVEESWSEVTYTNKQLDTAEKRFMKAAHAILVKKNGKLKAGDHCMWCRGKAVCPTYVRSIETKTSLAIIQPKEVSFPKPEHLSPEQLGKIVLHADEMIKALQGCKSYVYRTHAQGKRYPEIKVIEVKGRRAWIRDVKQIEETLKKHKLKDIYQEKLKPLTQIEKQLKKLKKENVLGSLVNQGSRAMIVPESDPRPEMKDFTNLLDDDSDEED